MQLGGGESSGHVVASDYLPTGDGLYVALTVAHYLVKTQTNLTEFSEKFFLWPSKSGFPSERKITSGRNSNPRKNRLHNAMQ